MPSDTIRLHPGLDTQHSILPLLLLTQHKQTHSLIHRGDNTCDGGASLLSPNGRSSNISPYRNKETLLNIQIAEYLKPNIMKHTKPRQQWRFVHQNSVR